jgi:tRNA-specific 2-thiouridylase
MNNKSPKSVFVAMSGGVDSSVAALLLKNEGYNVTGVFMKNWADPAWPCPWEEERKDAMRVCAKLDIPFETFDFTKEYKEKVVDYMIRGYSSGRTPNPDVMCNKEIKFGLFLDKALGMGADFIATGHYVRKSEYSKLLRAKYLNKDQSYFLWTLKQEQISKCLFPIGEFESKSKVREIAFRYDLPTAKKKDSQGICFMGPVDVQEFIKPYVKSDIGDIVTTDGAKIGTHAGLDFYTIGQRKGIGVGGTGPYYVARKDYESNTLVVASVSDRSALESKTVFISDVSFVNDEPQTSISIEASIRYRNAPTPAILSKLENGLSLARWKLEFEKPVIAVTSGQSAVFYNGDELLGGGVIE